MPAAAQFADRSEAGRELARALMHLKPEHPVVLALPRGGVPVGYEIARALEAPLDVVLVRKIGAPHQPELGLGAVVDGNPPQVVLNPELIDAIQPGQFYLDAERQRQLTEIERRRQLYRQGRPPLPLEKRTVVVVDDGIATGGTVKAVLEALSQSSARRVVLAVPVAPPDTWRKLSALVSEAVCLTTPERFHAVGAFYRNFEQTSDAEVIEILARGAQENLAR